MGLAYLKLKDYRKTIEFTGRAIEMCRPFVQYINNNPLMGRQSAEEGNQFLLKLYLRKAKAEFMTSQMEEALSSIKLALKIEEMNKEGREILQQIQKSMER